MRNRRWAVMVSLFVAASVLGGGAAFGRGGDGGVPSPFVETSNRKVELADGEMYTLFGKVVFDSSDVPFFWVDLKKHPWLANKKRAVTPFYRLMGSREEWREYNEQSIQLICIAKAMMVGGKYEIELTPLAQAGDKAITPEPGKP